MDKTMEEPRTIIADDVEIGGSIKCTGGVRIGGKMNGDLTCAGDVLVEKTCQIKGNLAVNSVVVLGAIKGNISARERIELKGNARVAGDIKAKRLVVEEGVTLIGKSEITASEAGSGEIALEMEGIGAGSDDAASDDAAKAGGQPIRGAVGGRPSQLFARK
jgi:cytoskeletal protein CcmA (bactofilin family)